MAGIVDIFFGARQIFSWHRLLRRTLVQQNIIEQREEALINLQPPRNILLRQD